jgi:hypothetical protein
MKLKNIVSVMTILIGLSLFYPKSSQAVAIDLTTFMPDPATAVTIAADGSSATIVEDVNYSSIWLYNDSIFIPADATALSFDYDFVLEANNSDELNAYLYDPGLGLRQKSRYISTNCIDMIDFPSYYLYAIRQSDNRRHPWKEN